MTDRFRDIWSVVVEYMGCSEVLDEVEVFGTADCDAVHFVEGRDLDGELAYAGCVRRMVLVAGLYLDGLLELLVKLTASAPYED